MPAKEYRRSATAFILRFFALLALVYGISAIPWTERNVVVPFTRVVTTISAAALNGIGQHVRAAGTVVSGASFSVSILNGCNGVEATMFLIAAIFAFPAGWQLRAWGLAIGFALVQLLNLLRIVTLFLLGRYQPQAFEFFHLAVWQTLIAAATIFFFLRWCENARRGDGAHAA
jgi:exosortase H (IPTLxxWG-CTERM-specific)